MNYFEKTGYEKEQNKKSITWEEVKNLPIYVKTKAGNLWHGGRIVPEKDIDKSCYIVSMSSKPIALYFFEEATFKRMKGVKLHLMWRCFSKAKASYDLAFNGRGLEGCWVFITPDWKTYDMEGNQIKIKNLGYNYGHDLRLTGQFREGMCNSFSCGSLLSPVTVDILRKAGFDMDTSMAPTWQIQSGYDCYDIPKDSYRTDWFAENLVHPNRVARRRKENSLIQHNYEYYHNLMGDENFLVFEEEGQVYVAQRSNDYHNGITVSYLKMPKCKTPSCVFYSTKGAKKLTDSSISSVLRREWGCDDDHLKRTCKNVIDQLLGKRQLLEKTEVFKNLLPELERTKEALNDEPLKRIDRKFTKRIHDDLSYILSPVGQKDRVFEETVKQNGLGRGLKAESFLRIIGEYNIAPALKQKTPYGQVGLTKSAYYGLRKLIDDGVSINLRAMIQGLTNGNSWMYFMTKEEYLSKRSEFCPYLTADFLDLLKRTVSISYDPWGISYDGPSAESWGSLLRLAGKSLSSPLSEKIAAATRLLKKFDSDASLSVVFEKDNLRDYYRQVDELAPLGIDWPQRYEEFHVKNVMWFLGTLQRRYRDLVDQAESVIPNASFERRTEILHEMQNQISALNKLEIEKAALQEMDKQYAPWKEQLKKALEWKNRNFGIFIPESLAELTMEGKILHHCVGSYKRDVAQRKEGILFLRKLSCPDMPYYTLDVVKEPSGKYTVRQCHGNCNSNPTPEVIEALKKWAADTGKVDESSIKDDYRALCCI
jgi:hypothetical protein